MQVITPELTIENAAEQVDAALSMLGDKPTEPKTGRGIVIAAGGVKFQINAWVCIRMLRQLGCKLPIECWYLGERERNLAWEEIVEPYGVTCIDAHEVRKRHPHARLQGWELKPYAIQHSPFREVLFMDADNVPVRDPEFLFETQEFVMNRAIFWPDYGRLAPDRLAWKVFGNIPYRNEPEFESGQIVVDTVRCWRALELCHWYMQNSNNFFFDHVHGDKEVFHLAWRKLEMAYAMPERAIRSLPGVMCQHDFEGLRVFQHRNMRKWSFYDNPRTRDFEYEFECLDFIRELKGIWSPASQEQPSDADREMMASLDGKVFEYKRIGHDQRRIALSSDGTFARGAARCEYYWTIRNGQMRISDDGAQLMMSLNRAQDGVWRGRWLQYECMPIELTPTHEASS